MRGAGRSPAWPGPRRRGISVPAIASSTGPRQPAAGTSTCWAYNTRFLILPCVEVAHLASHILSRVAQVLPRDWAQIYGHSLYFLETFVDPQRHPGTCYRAANWILLGHTTGRGKDAPSKRSNRPIKAVLGYPISKHFRARLSA